MCLGDLRSLRSGAGAASEVQGRRRSPTAVGGTGTSTQRGPRRQLLVAIWADARRSKPSELPVRVLQQTAQFVVRRGVPAMFKADSGSAAAAAGHHIAPSTRGGPDGRRRLLSGPIRVIQSPQSCPSACPSELLSPWSNPGGASVVKCPRRFPRLWLLQRKRASGPPMAADGRHPGLSASLKAHRAACPRAMANCAAFGRTQGPPARPRANGGPPPLLAATRKSTRRGPPTAAGRCWSPSGPIRAL